MPNPKWNYVRIDKSSNLSLAIFFFVFAVAFGVQWYTGSSTSFPGLMSLGYLLIASIYLWRSLNRDHPFQFRLKALMTAVTVIALVLGLIAIFMHGN